MINDSLADQPVAVAEAMMSHALEVFIAWGLPKPLALRAGNMNASLTVYEAMVRTGLDLGSNVGCGVFLPSEETLHVFSGAHEVRGVVERPVLSFRGLGPSGVGLRALTITGCSFQEMRSVLEQAHGAGIEDIVLLTHAHDFVKKRDVRYESIVPSPLHQRRLWDLCRYLKDNTDRFATPAMSQASSRATVRNPLLKTSSWQGVQRLFANKLHDLF